MGEVETVKCEEKNAFTNLISEAISPLISEDITSLRLMQEEILENYSELQERFDKLAAIYTVQRNEYLKKNQALEISLKALFGEMKVLEEKLSKSVPIDEPEESASRELSGNLITALTESKRFLQVSVGITTQYGHRVIKNYENQYLVLGARAQ